MDNECFNNNKGNYTQTVERSRQANEPDKLKEGDELIIEDAWGAIEYKGPGYLLLARRGNFFIAILRDLHKKNPCQLGASPER